MVYLIPIFLCLLYSLKYDSTSGGFALDVTSYSKRRFIFIFVWLVAISALQYCVGYDIPIYTSNYADSKYLTLTDIWGDARYRPGWQLLLILCHKISDDFLVLKIIQSIFLGFCVYNFFSRYSRYWYLTLFFYILFAYGELNFGLMRQSFAVSVFLLAVPYLENRSTKRERLISLAKYYGLVYIASLFHSSAFILIIVPLLNYLVTTPKRLSVSLFVFFVCAVIISQTPGFSLMLYSYIASSEDVAINATYYLTSGDYVGSKIGFSLILAFIPTLLAVLCLFLNRYKETPQDKVLKMLLYLYILMGIFNIAIPIFYRFNHYFVFAYIILMPMAIYEGVLMNETKVLRSPIIKFALFGMFILYPINHLVAVHPAFGFPGYRIYYPYYSVFDPQIDQERNRIINFNN